MSVNEQIHQRLIELLCHVSHQFLCSSEFVSSSDEETNDTHSSWSCDLWTLSNCWVYIHAFGRFYLKWLSGAHLISSCNPWESNPWRWRCKRQDRANDQWAHLQSQIKWLKHKPGLDTLILKEELITFMLFQTWMAFVLRRNNADEIYLNCTEAEKVWRSSGTECDAARLSSFSRAFEF